MDLFPFLKIYSPEEINAIVRKRQGETKLGERIKCIKNFPEDLLTTDCKFVILGLPEDVGVRANYGRGGAHTAWKPALENILNTQSNLFCTGENILILGHIDFDDILKKSETLNKKTKQENEYLRKLVEFIDLRVYAVVKKIIEAGKIPVIIGGGHNNSYPNIRATNDALKQSNKISHKGIYVINCDPHADMRPLEGRHSGNGFSYAFEEGLLKKYAVFGLHESYNSEKVLSKFEEEKGNLYYETFENIFVREKITFENALENCINFCMEQFCGIELDLDAITNVPTSAKTSSGLSPVQARQFIYKSARNLNACYLHIAEGAPILAHIKADNKTGKLISYLVLDFIKGVSESKR